MSAELIPNDGVVTQWRYLTKRNAPFKAIVFRRKHSNKWIPEIVGINEIPSAPANQDVTYNVSKEEQLHVKEGDLIGWAVTTGVFGGDFDRYCRRSIWPDLSYVRYQGYPFSQVRKGTRISMAGGQCRAYSIQVTIESGKEIKQINILRTYCCRCRFQSSVLKVQNDQAVVTRSRCLRKFKSKSSYFIVKGYHCNFIAHLQRKMVIGDL